MKRHFLLLVALLLVFACVLSFTACLGDTPGENPGENPGTNPDDPETPDNGLDNPPPNEYIASEGLDFSSNGDGTCSVIGIGTCTDTDVKIPNCSPEGDWVTSIGDSAFGWCSSLTSITFQGTKYQWNAIDKGGNLYTGSSIKTVHCTDGVIEL